MENAINLRKSRLSRAYEYLRNNGYINIHELRKLRDFPAEEHLKKYVDIFLLSFYLAGINMVDLLRLKPLKRDERLNYRRSKTGVLCNIY